MTISAGSTILAADVQAIKDDVDAILTATGSSIATSETTSSTSFVDLATSGPAITLTTGTKALVIVSCQASSDAANGESIADFAVSGATTRAATTTTAWRFESDSAGQSARFSTLTLLTSLTAGSNTFTMKYRTGSGNTSTFVTRSIYVIPLGA